MSDAQHLPSSQGVRETASDAQESLRDKILAERDNGNLVYAHIEGYSVVSVEDFVKQPVDGMLYDLNRGEEVSLSFITEKKWVNDFAVALTIRKLVEQRDKSQRELAAKEREANDAHEKAHRYYCELQQARGEAQWIPVSERLPDAGQVVVAACKATDGAVMRIVGHRNERMFWILACTEEVEITHWMPLPAAPSPARGEQINADAQARDGLELHQGQPVQPASSAPNTAPQAPCDPVPEYARPEAYSDSPNSVHDASLAKGVQIVQPAAAVPDDPVVSFEDYWRDAKDGCDDSSEPMLRAWASDAWNAALRMAGK